VKSVANFKFVFLILLIGTKIFSQNIDLHILKSINQTDHKLWDESMKVTSDGVYPFMVISPAALWLTGYVNKDEIMKRNSVKTVIAIGGNIAIMYALKETVKRPRPYTTYPDDIVLRQKASGFSFPSGHTSCAFATATALTLSTKKWYIAVPAFTYAGFVGYSRMRLGAHYASDVLAGIIVGVGTSLLTWQCDKWINNK
jgi:membrane-associated phospholipid phosphatase